MFLLWWYLSATIILSLFKVLMKIAQGFCKGNNGKQLTFLLTLEKNEETYIAAILFRISNNFLFCCS